MRQFRICVFLLAVVAFAAAKQETLDQLKQRAESARPEDKVKLYLKIAQEQVHTADMLYDQGRIKEAQAAVDDVVIYCQKARDAATISRKHLKHAEIGVRKIEEKLNDIKRSLAYEDQAPVANAIQKLEEIRAALLDAMFGKEKK